MNDVYTMNMNIKILHLSMHECSGAGRAAVRLHQGLLQESYDSSMLVLQKGLQGPLIFQIPPPLVSLKKVQAKLLGSQLRRVTRTTTTFSINATPSLILQLIKRFKADIINLHWVGWDYLKIEDLRRLQVPLVWTLQDMWPFTGGCHYNGTCDRYMKSCGACPQLQSTKDTDLSRWVWQRKMKAWKELDLTIVAPSQWIADCARQSSLFGDRRIEVIPFCLDTQVYQPVDRQMARAALNLPLDRQIVLFGALSAMQDERKGFQFLLPALQKLSQSGWGDRIELVIFGASEPDTPTNLGFTTHYLGSLNDEGLVNAYSAADVMIVPSTQESFGQTASESLACGTPVVAFNTTGLKDIVDHQQNGYLAKPYDAMDLAHGITWVLEDNERLSNLKVQALEKVRQAFSLEIQPRQYVSLYKSILDKQH